ncbi:competence type IV pilus minor pilin ComGF [Lysinibacillus endophyticus]|nr:competence type IV pilus minor pilin ComGF [Lysinibacillus endophyticus]MCP1145217.1 ComGF family competence protein [Lysinibacillus endophyticus]
MYQRNWRNRLNSSGFTLIEALFSFIVFALFIHLLIFIYSWLNQMNDSITNNDHVAWELFVNDFEQYLSNVKHIEQSNTRAKTIQISYVNSNEIVVVDQYQDIIRMQKNYLGYIPLLMGIKNSSFRLNGNYITVYVEFQSGAVKEREFFVQIRNE